MIHIIEFPPSYIQIAILCVINDILDDDLLEIGITYIREPIQQIAWDCISDSIIEDVGRNSK